MATVAELVTSVWDTVTRIQQLKQELASLLQSVQDGQDMLAKEGVVMDFPVLRESMPGSIKVVAAVTSTEEGSTGHVLAVPMIPAQPPPPTDEELADEEALAQEEDLSRALPGSDTRPAAAIRNESLSIPTSPADDEAFRRNAAAKMERAILQGYEDSGKKGSRFMVGL